VSLVKEYRTRIFTNRSEKFPVDLIDWGQPQENVSFYHNPRPTACHKFINHIQVKHWSHKFIMTCESAFYSQAEKKKGHLLSSRVHKSARWEIRSAARVLPQIWFLTSIHMLIVPSENLIRIPCAHIQTPRLCPSLYHCILPTGDCCVAKAKKWPCYLVPRPG
jgi:hypothetical protein